MDISELQEAVDDLRRKAGGALDVKDELGRRMDALERKMNRAGTDFGGGGGHGSEAARIERKAFAQWAKSGDRAALARLEQKAVDADFGTNSTAGGVAVPEVIASEVIKRVRDLSPMRRLVRVTEVASPNYERLVDVNGTASGWAGETTTRSETGTPTVQRVQFTHGELYAVPKASNWALNDIMFDVEGWLSERVAEEFAQKEGAAIIAGDGTNKPTGFLNGTPVATDDDASPARAFGTLEYVPTGKADGFQNDRLGSPAGDPTAVFYNCWSTLRAGYRQNATWLMNSNTLSTIMQFRDADGRRLVREAMTDGAPNMLLGRPIEVMEDMPNVAAGAFPVAFGDWRQGYELIDITGLTVIRDDVTTKGHTLFYVARRLGGKVTDDHAIKLIKCATS